MGKWVSTRALVAAFGLMTLHFAIVVYVNWQDVQYDDGSILWWLAYFWVLPIAALLTVLVSAAKKAF
jgi:hypothetical protein